MIFVLPILLYPILGIGVVQFSARPSSRSPGRSWWSARSTCPDAPAAEPGRGRVRPGALRHPGTTPSCCRGQDVRPRFAAGPNAPIAGAAVREGLADAVVIVPPDLTGRIAARNEADGSSTSPTTAPTSGARSPPARSRRSSAKWKDRIVAGPPGTRRASPRATPSRSRRPPTTWRPRRRRRQRLGAALPVPAGDDVADRGLLPGRRPLRRREGAGDDGDPADQPGLAGRDRRWASSSRWSWPA